MRKTVPALLALALAMAVVVLADLRWWHPYCDSPDDGPGFWATGFPLPYAEPTGVSSLDFTLLVPILLLDVALGALPFFFLLRPAWRASSAIVRMLIGAAILAAAGFALLVLNLGAVPRFATSFSEAYDSLTAYRPAFAVDFTRHRPCDR
jgi:hypothetical protein